MGMPYIPYRGKRKVIHIPQLVAFSVFITDYICDMNRDFVSPDFFSRFKPLSHSRFQALLDWKGDWSEICTDFGRHAVIIMDSYHKRIIPAHFGVNAMRLVWWVLDCINQFSQFLSYLFYWFFSDMAFHYIAWLPFVGFIFPFATGNHLHSESKKFRIFFFKIDNLWFFWTYIQSEAVFQPPFCCIEQFHCTPITTRKNLKIIGVSYTGYLL